MSLDVKSLIQEAMAEDLPNGDLTSDSLGIRHQLGYARLVAKEDLVLSGSLFFDAAVKHLSPEAKIDWKFKDGDFVLSGQVLASLHTDLIALLKAERTGLNFLGRLSGIATLTRIFVERVKGTDCQILDTRKTTPLYRAWEKAAVRHGQGQNHRMNLSSAILIKDNHIRLCGSLSEAVRRIRIKSEAPIEVECSSLAEVQEAVGLGVRRIMLDNMSPSSVREALGHIPRNIESEVSGNVDLENIRAYAETGVNFISIGALTHSAPCADFSLLFEWKSI